MTKTIAEIELAEAEKKLKEVTDAQRAAQDAVKRAHFKLNSDRLTKLKPLVIRAHDLLCKWNHTDGCGWGYETSKEFVDGHNWDAYAHYSWLTKYDAIVNGADATSYRQATQPLGLEKLESFLSALEIMKKNNAEALLLFRSNGLNA